tara:strand:- start:181 stop:765 length:585 start_codon:yes stop_codon:yes gene_type:complete
MSSILSASGILGILSMWLSLLFLMLVVGSDLKNSDWRDYDAKWPCSLSQAESDRVYNWSLVALFMWIITQGAAMLKYSKYSTGVREYFEQNDNPRRALNLVFVLSGQIYAGAIFILASQFEWGLTCNNYDKTLRGANFLWGSVSLWLVGVACMHAMPGKWVTPTLNGTRPDGAILRAEHIVGMGATEKISLLRK